MSRNEIHRQAFIYASIRVDTDEARAYADDCRQRFDDGEPAIAHWVYFLVWNKEESWA